MPTLRPATPPSSAKPGGLRALTEWLVLLALAVTLFRCFGVESYMISTGSMAPCLLGFHTRITCPACGLVFAHGAPSPTDPAETPRQRVLNAQAVALSGDGPETIPCPNCSRLCAIGRQADRTEGDQLLVHKDAYMWRELAGKGGPRRWEIVVFRNPDDAQLAYVKRIVGLPGETIELVDGDVFADGKLQRKPLSAQLSVRIPVSLHDHAVLDDDLNWEPRWQPSTPGSAWNVSDTRFLHVPRTAPAGSSTTPAKPESWDWITYRHWVRSGGATVTSVALSRWPDGLAPPDAILSPLQYDAAGRRLTCLGALSHAQWERWDAATQDRDFQKALWELYQESHVVALTDASPYNAPGATPPNFIHDLLLELALEWRGGAGEFAIEMTDGAREFRAELDFGRGEVRLIADDNAVLAKTSWKVVRDAPMVLVMSVFDQQLLLAQDGRMVCDPIPYQRGAEPLKPLRRPVRFGVRNAAVAVSHVGLFRDVFYTNNPERTSQTYTLPEREYFVLGDNSGVSIDSRNWERPGVPESSLIGKPLVLHLPSRSLRLEWGDKVRQIRVPDFSRMRYIR
ncbi:MAG: S26 family signal peptidase [Planctomycetaceae bacterium]